MVTTVVVTFSVVVGGEGVGGVSIVVTRVVVFSVVLGVAAVVVICSVVDGVALVDGVTVVVTAVSTVVMASVVDASGNGKIEKKTFIILYDSLHVRYSFS